MGVVIRIFDDNFSDLNIGFVPPLSDGLEYLNFFEGGAANAGRNLAPGKPSLSVVGAPTFGAYNITLTNGSSFLQSAVAQTADMTFLFVVAPTADATAYVCSNYSGARQDGGTGTSVGSSLYFAGGTAGDGNVNCALVQSRRATGNTGSGSPQSAAGVPADAISAAPFMLFGRTRAADSTIYVENMTTGASGTTVATDNYDGCVNPFRIGSSPTPAGVGASVDVYCGMICSIALTDQQKFIWRDFVRGYYARRGITV